MKQDKLSVLSGWTLSAYTLQDYYLNDTQSLNEFGEIHYVGAVEIPATVCGLIFRQLQPDSAATHHILCSTSRLHQYDRPNQAKRAPTSIKPHHHRSRRTCERSHVWWCIGRIGRIGCIFWCVEGWVKGQSSVGTGEIQVTWDIRGVEGPYTPKGGTTVYEVCCSIFFLKESLVKKTLQKMGKRDLRENIPAISEALQTDWTHGPYASEKEELLQTQCRRLSPWQPLKINPLEVQLF